MLLNFAFQSMFPAIDFSSFSQFLGPFGSTGSTIDVKPIVILALINDGARGKVVL